jgi:hypothetical protein
VDASCHDLAWLPSATHQQSHAINSGKPVLHALLVVLLSPLVILLPAAKSLCRRPRPPPVVEGKIINQKLLHHLREWDATAAGYWCLAWAG